MTRRLRHWIAAASLAAAAAGGFTVSAAAAGGFSVSAATSGSQPVHLLNERQAGAEQGLAPSSADGTVITVHGDTAKDALTKAGWGDGIPANTNIVLTGIAFNGLD
jgi:hypothetical protein